jgi:GR25 family glycosyltransferase involved in LPS biosynthesis
VVCITVNDDGYTRMGGLYGDHTSNLVPLSATREHFVERGINATFFQGIHAARLGLYTELPYQYDTGPESDFKIPPKAVGCWLSHRALWAALLLSSHELTLVVEDDAWFPSDWRARTEKAIRDGGDFDMLFVGSCCAEDKPRRHVYGDVYEVHWPFCTHAYIIRRRALKTLIDELDAARCYGPIDISLGLHAFPKLDAVYTVLPRIVDQRGIVIPP